MPPTAIEPSDLGLLSVVGRADSGALAGFDARSVLGSSASQPAEWSSSLEQIEILDVRCKANLIPSFSIHF